MPHSTAALRLLCNLSQCILAGQSRFTRDTSLPSRWKYPAVYQGSGGKDTGKSSSLEVSESYSKVSLDRPHTPQQREEGVEDSNCHVFFQLLHLLIWLACVFYWAQCLLSFSALARSRLSLYHTVCKFLSAPRWLSSTRLLQCICSAHYVNSLITFRFRADVSFLSFAAAAIKLHFSISFAFGLLLPRPCLNGALLVEAVIPCFLPEYYLFLSHLWVYRGFESSS